MLTAVDVSAVADRGWGDLDAAVAVWRARDDERTGLRVVPGFNNREEIETIGGYTVDDLNEFFPDWARIENTEFIYIAWLSPLNGYKCNQNNMADKMC